MEATADEIIAKLNLEPLPMEGGFYRETYRSSASVDNPPGHCAGTMIYYLLKNGSVSTWHKVSLDEFWLYHGGGKAVQILLFDDGHWEERLLGPDPGRNEVPQSLIPAGTWQATVPVLEEKAGWVLFSAAVIPGFEFADYLHGESPELMAQWPEARNRCETLGLA